jgi:hypothetical protein
MHALPLDIPSLFSFNGNVCRCRECDGPQEGFLSARSPFDAKKNPHPTGAGWGLKLGLKIPYLQFPALGLELVHFLGLMQP